MLTLATVCRDRCGIHKEVTHPHLKTNSKNSTS